MLTRYDSFVIQETLSEYFPLNENAIPTKIQNAAEEVANEVNDEVAQKVEQEYGDKSLKQIIQQVYKVIKDLGVGEYAKDVASGAIASVVKWIAKKVGEYSTIGLIVVALVDKVVPFGLLDSWFTKIEWKLGIAILISLVIYIVARKLKKRRK